MISCHFSLFNTRNVISIEHDNTEILDQAIVLCERFELLFSRFAPESQLYQLNHAQGAPCTLDSELLDCIQAALYYCKESHGAFDITMGCATSLWNFKRRIIPSNDELRSALQNVNYQAVSIDQSVVTLKNPHSYIDLGGIAKGYIADALIDHLLSQGVQHALINLGGNIAVMGGKPDGSPWRIGIRKPISSHDAPGNDYFAVIELFDGSAVTSGTYERAFIQDGKLYHHILNPQTGMPAETDLVSATIIAKRSIDADGFTTPLIIMGARSAMEFVERHPNIEAVLKTNDDGVLTSSGIGRTVPFTLLDE